MGGRGEDHRGQLTVITTSVAAVFLITVAVACGDRPAGHAARVQSRNLDWHENCGTAADPLRVATRRITVGRKRWAVDVAFTNETRVTLSIARPRVPGGTYFGLEPFTTSSRREVEERVERLAAKPRTLVDRFDPPLPRVLTPGEGWAGSFSGPGALPARTPIRVVLGRFEIMGSVPRGFFHGFLCISERSFRLM